jgi:GMP synthase (glutamine-hydrolysing)
MKVLVVENYPAAPIGLFGNWLERRRGARLTVVPAEGLSERRGDEDLLVVLGSPSGAWEQLPWITRQRAILRERIEAGQPVIGICFGAQIIASAIGGVAKPYSRRICGWLENDEVAAPLWRGPWLRWHGDHLVPPAGAEILARGQGTVQAFQYRRTVGVQFHPEVSEDSVRAWAGAMPQFLAENGLTAERMAADTHANITGGEAARAALFDEMLRRTLAPAPLPQAVS